MDIETPTLNPILKAARYHTEDGYQVEYPNHWWIRSIYGGWQVGVSVDGEVQWYTDYHGSLGWALDCVVASQLVDPSSDAPKASPGRSNKKKQPPAA